MRGAFVDADVRPMTDPDATTTALLWDEGRILLVGSDAAVAAEARRRGITPTPLEGRVVLPGFVDAHMHAMHLGLRGLRPWLSDARSRTEAIAAIAAHAATHPGPVIAEAWDESRWDDRAFPTRSELDHIARDRPIVARRVDGHTAVGNTAAVRLLGARWPDNVDQDSGLLLEEPSLYLNDVIPMPEHELEAALDAATRTALSEGCTTMGAYERAPFRATCLRAAEEGRLAIRLVLSIYEQQFDAEVAAGFRTGRARSARLRDGGLKLFLDGSIGGRTAYLRAPYADGQTRGRRTYTDQQLMERLERAHAAGIQVHAHAIGDAAIDQGLDAFASLARRDDWWANRLRHRFEHYELVHDDQIAATARLGLVASVQPNFVGAWSRRGGLYHQALGEGYTLNNRFRTLQRAGVPLAFGSDGMPFGPRVGMQAAIAHHDHAQRMGAAEAVWHYTAAAAHALHIEDAVGHLGVGMCADMAILDHAWNERPGSWVLHSTWLDGQRAWPS